MSDSKREGRPKPIGVSDGSESEEGSDQELGEGQSKKAAASQIAAVDEPAKKPSTSRRIPAFSENNLVMEKGLLKVYKEFPKKCKYKGRGREAEFLRGVMVAYKEWGHQLYPALAFEDLASRIQKLSGKARVRDLMREMRDEERDRFVESKYGRSAVEEARARKAAKITENENPGGVEDREADDTEEFANTRYAGRTEAPQNESNASERDTNTVGSITPARKVTSPGERKRMETSRQVALGRLQTKVSGESTNSSTKEAAASGINANFNDMPPDDEIIDLMDVDCEAGREISNDFEDDDDALAEMEAEERGAQPNKTMASEAHTEGDANAAFSGAATHVSPARIAGKSGSNCMDSSPAGDNEVVTPVPSTQSAGAAGRSGDDVNMEESGHSNAGDLVADGTSFTSEEGVSERVSPTRTTTERDASTFNSSTSEFASVSSPVTEVTAIEEDNSVRMGAPDEAVGSPKSCKATITGSPPGSPLTGVDVSAEG